MKRKWYESAKYPFNFPLGPISFDSDDFDRLFVRTKICDDIDKYLKNIRNLHGFHWIASEGGGYGKSTMLQYIARSLVSQLPHAISFPLIVHVSGDRNDIPIRAAFIQDFLREFLSIGELLQLQEPERGNSWDRDGLDFVRREFAEYKEKVRSLRDQVFELDRGSLEQKLHNLVDNALKDWTVRGVRIVLLIDEIDKLSTVEVESFLGKNQKLFEKLADLNTVFFITGHRSWVDSIHSGTEYSYYKGEIFDIPPFIDVEDIRKLVETRQTQYLLIHPYESPWTDKGLERLREITNGIPRRTIGLASKVLNYAYDQEVIQIGPSVVTSTIVKSEGNREILKWLKERPHVFAKLKNAISTKVDSTLPVFYDNPNHAVPKSLDDELSQRTAHLKVENSDREWKEKIETLLRIECLRDRRIMRRLDDDIIEFFRLIDSKNIPLPYFPQIVDMLETEPEIRSTETEPPNFRDACRRGFRVSGSDWLTEDQIYRYFKATTNVEVYLKGLYGDSWDERVKEYFRRYWDSMRDDSDIAVTFENSTQYFRELPRGVSRDEYDTISAVGSRRIVDSYLELANGDSERFRDVALSSIEELFGKLCELKKVSWGKDYLDDAGKVDAICGKLGLEDNDRWRIEQLLREFAMDRLNPSIIADLARDALKRLSDFYLTEKQLRGGPERGRGFEARVRELVRSFGDGDIALDDGYVFTTNRYETVQNEEFGVDGNRIEIDIYARRLCRDSVKVLLGECKLRKETTVGREDIQKFASKVQKFFDSKSDAYRQVYGKNIEIERRIYFTAGIFDDDALVACEELEVTPIDGDLLNALLKKHRLHCIR